MSHSDPRASDRRESAQDLPGEDQPVSSSAERPATRPSRFKGPIVLRGREAHRRTSDQRLLEQGGPQDFGHDDDFTRTDPWRIMRIQSEFVDGFDTLARLGPAVTVFGSARVPEGAAADITPDLQRMLTERGLADARIHVIPETRFDERGLLPQEHVAGLRAWLETLAADAQARGAVARRTVDGVLGQLAARVADLARAEEEQRHAADLLARIVGDSTDQAVGRVREATSDGTLLRGEVLSRWQDFVGTGEFSYEDMRVKCIHRWSRAICCRSASLRVIRSSDRRALTLLRRIGARHPLGGNVGRRVRRRPARHAIRAVDPRAGSVDRRA